MIDIEQIIEQFDEHIDNGLPVYILGKQYSPSEIARTLDHSHYCKQLDKFIAERYEFDGDYYYLINGD